MKKVLFSVLNALFAVTPLLTQTVIKGLLKDYSSQKLLPYVKVSIRG
ncbi:MAG: hypothetical protein ACMUEM_06580 [Flavobacteriales bacterium AspAUS03]